MTAARRRGAFALDEAVAHLELARRYVADDLATGSALDAQSILTARDADRR